MKENSIIYLYVKQHRITGLKYFGKTISKDPYKYKGSGIYWSRHLKQHGNLVDTEIIGEFDDPEKCKQFAIQFSEENDIVNSSEWANLKIEELDGGWSHVNSLPQEIRSKWQRDAWNLLTEEQQKEINSKKARFGKDNYWFGKDRSGENNPRYGVHDDYETYKKISESNKGRTVVKDAKTGDIIGFVSINHPNVVSGDWVSVNVGKTRTDEWKQKRSEQYKALGIKPPSPKGMLWWNDGQKVVRAKSCPGDGFVRGKKIILSTINKE